MTMTPLPDHAPEILQLLAGLDSDRDALLDYYKSGYAQKDGKLYAMDLFVLGAVKRTLSLTAAMKLMIQTWNLLAARTLLRTHIDTALRFSAAWLVEDPENFSFQVLEGKRIDQMKHGKELMRDSYLIRTLSDDHPWLKEVYENLSGYVHFSGTHITSSLFDIQEDGTFGISLSDTDMSYPDASWAEILECFRDTTNMVLMRMAGYSAAKKK
jgi:hypothetical protein